MLDPMRIRLVDADRERYSAAEWLLIGPAQFADMPLLKLRYLEQQTGVNVLDFVLDIERTPEGPQPRDRSTIEFLALLSWFAWQASGGDGVDFADWDAHVLAMKVEKVRPEPGSADADPPSPSSAGTSAETPAKPKRRSSPRRSG